MADNMIEKLEDALTSVFPPITIDRAMIDEYNFYEQADEKGCSSIITERGQDECARVQRAKDDACNVPVDCDVDKQEWAIAKDKDAKDRFDRGQRAETRNDAMAASAASRQAKRAQAVAACRIGMPPCRRGT
jgi:hypothetical protein